MNIMGLLKARLVLLLFYFLYFCLKNLNFFSIDLKEQHLKEKQFLVRFFVLKKTIFWNRETRNHFKKYLWSVQNFIISKYTSLSNFFHVSKKHGITPKDNVFFPQNLNFWNMFLRNNFFEITLTALTKLDLAFNYKITPNNNIKHALSAHQAWDPNCSRTQSSDPKVDPGLANWTKMHVIFLFFFVFFTLIEGRLELKVSSPRPILIYLFFFFFWMEGGL